MFLLNVPPSPPITKNLLSCSPLKWLLWDLFPRNQTHFQGFWAAVVRATCCSVHFLPATTGRLLGYYCFSENTTHFSRTSTRNFWEKTCCQCQYPKRNLRFARKMGPWASGCDHFWMGWNWKSTEFHSTAHFCSSSWNFPNSLNFFVKKKNVKELSVVILVV